MDQESLDQHYENDEDDQKVTYYYSKFDLFDQTLNFSFVKYQIFKNHLQEALGITYFLFNDNNKTQARTGSTTPATWSTGSTPRATSGSTRITRTSSRRGCRSGSDWETKSITSPCTHLSLRVRAAKICSNLVGLSRNRISNARIWKLIARSKAALMIILRLIRRNKIICTCSKLIKRKMCRVWRRSRIRHRLLIWIISIRAAIRKKISSPFWRWAIYWVICINFILGKPSLLNFWIETAVLVPGLNNR